ncbi:TrkH family potassium uptake protein [Magnetospira sp. QH-2]|uniref:TrkH family potassium uptake protein n=1 Tax=Magnetospira sp. (strain QH-2) TaxID=1288970 RepID=UPI0003E81970|nr:Potassium transporter [Magnetospira sp. QH-2]
MSILALGMCVPAVVDAALGHPDWQVFAVSAAVTLFVGISLVLAFGVGGTDMNVRQAFIMTTVAWTVLTTFAALPFAFCELELSITDAFFESMSGITTTGSTVIVGLDNAPPGILLWRGLLQWLGGVGIIVMAIAILPMLRVGGMQLFQMESADASEKAMPRAYQIALGITGIYILFTAACTVAYWGAGMDGFEAVIHAMTTIATGGYSTSDASMAHFDSMLIDFIAVGGMVAGSLPFLLYLKALQGDVVSLARDEQVRWFLAIGGAAVIIASILLWINQGLDPVQALRYGSFNVISIMTGTGYATTDYGLWGAFANPMFYFLMFVGGCAGSTSCGIKIFRFQVLFAAARTQFHHLVHPHGVFIPYYNRRPIPDEVITSVLSFFFVFGVCFALLSIALAMLGLDFITAVSSAATAIANVGPGLGPIVGPAGNFQTLPDAAKWLMSGGMLLGRLELFTILILFTRHFWKG